MSNELTYILFSFLLLLLRGRVTLKIGFVECWSICFTSSIIIFLGYELLCWWRHVRYLAKKNIRYKINHIKKYIEKNHIHVSQCQYIYKHMVAIRTTRNRVRVGIICNQSMYEDDFPKRLFYGSFVEKKMQVIFCMFAYIFIKMLRDVRRKLESSILI